MSMAPNNPFETEAGNPNSPQQQAPKKKSNGCLWAVIIAGVLGLMVCCGGGFYMYQMATGFAATQLQDNISGSPVIAEHIGEIESLSMSIQETSKEAERRQAEGTREPGSDRIVFTVSGSKGSGLIVASQDLTGGELVMPDGNRYPIGGGSADMDIDFDPGDIDMGTGDDEIDLPKDLNITIPE